MEVFHGSDIHIMTALLGPMGRILIKRQQTADSISSKTRRINICIYSTAKS